MRVIGLDFVTRNTGGYRLIGPMLHFLPSHIWDVAGGRNAVEVMAAPHPGIVAAPTAIGGVGSITITG